VVVVADGEATADFVVPRFHLLQHASRRSLPARLSISSIIYGQLAEFADVSVNYD
jgi:hypothetical protein